MMVIRSKQYLSNIWSSIHDKVKQHWSWLEKKRVYHLVVMGFCLYIEIHLLCQFFYARNLFMYKNANETIQTNTIWEYS